MKILNLGQFHRLADMINFFASNLAISKSTNWILIILGLLDSSHRDEHFDMCLISVGSILIEICKFEFFVTQDLSYFSILRGPHGSDHYRAEP